MIQWKKYRKYDIRFIFQRRNDYSEENTYDNEIFRSSILEPFQFEAERKNTCDNETHEKEAKHIHALAANLLYMRIGNLDWCKSGIAKTKREKQILFLVERWMKLITSAKITECEWSISPSSFLGICLTIIRTC